MNSNAPTTSDHIRCLVLIYIFFLTAAASFSSICTLFFPHRSLLTVFQVASARSRVDFDFSLFSLFSCLSFNHFFALSLILSFINIQIRISLQSLVEPRTDCERSQHRRRHRAIKRTKFTEIYCTTWKRYGAQEEVNSQLAING